jgi:hypothetical protein
MSSRTYRIHGTAINLEQPPKSSLVKIKTHRRLMPGRARDGITDELDVASDEVVRVELNNGFVQWIRADDLIREYGEHTLSRDGADVWEFSVLGPQLGAAGNRDERGVLGLAIKVLDFFGIEIEKKAAKKLGGVAEAKLLQGHAPGFYRCSLADEFSLKPVADDEVIPIDKGPILVFIHGTASSCQGSFGKLWESDNPYGKEARDRFAQRYGERVFAFEHLSLTESPISNALALAGHLPKGGEVHLISHSRGGMIGELLCLGGCEDVGAILTKESIKQLFAADRTIWEQIGLSPLNERAQRDRDAAYEHDREALDTLIRLLKDGFKVKRFVRVACPARGTTLASGRLDRWLSMLSFLFEKATGGGLFSDGVDFLFSVVKERTDPRALPGLEAMMPGSALTRLLHLPKLETQSDLSVISGDMEGDTLLEKLGLKQLVSDWFYSADNDLVVNTGSMSGGLKRPPKGARFLRDQGPEVNHFSYFMNRKSVQWLVAGLTRADDDDGGFQLIEKAQKEQPRWRDAVTASHAATRPRPLAVVLPGTMGSELKFDNELIWLDYWSLFLGGLKKISMENSDRVSTTDRIIDDYYGSLLEFLSRTHRVEVFAYDWRRSVCDAAEQLADRLEACLPQVERENQPVHLVAHSMGGLVVRAMIADTKRGNALWRRITRLPSSRFLMLGTPNLGSYEAVRWLTGTHPTETKLSLLDMTQSTDRIVNLVRQFPGLLELLPFAPQDADFSDLKPWRAIQQTINAGWKTATSDDLLRAGDTWERLRSSALDPQHMRYVAGCQPATVIGYQFSDYDASWLIGRKRLDFLATSEGDGTVPWSSGLLPGIQTWYVEDTAHDALCVKKGAFAGYLDILMTGGTSRLPVTPPQTARDAAKAGRTFILPVTPPVDAIPAPEDLRHFGFGAGTLPADVDDRPVTSTIEVSISHGDLSYARHPVLVGHYLGDSILSAESVIDRQLKGVLKHLLDLGLYPGRLGTHRVFFNDDPVGKPAGAIVVGLGQVGDLTAGLLQSGVTSALLDYALQLSRWPDARFGQPGAPRNASISCLLVGTSAGGMTPSDSMEAILRGATAANERLMQADLDNRVTIDKLEFLELYEDLAIAATDALRSILMDGELASVVRWPDQVLLPGQAGQRRVHFDEAPGWWHRLEICEDENLPNTLRFNFATDRARAEETLSQGQLTLADAFIKTASSSARSNQEVARTLFEMLLPVRIREQAPRQSNLVVLVDECSARYPWELLEDRWSRDPRPPAVRAGLIRQLKTPVFRDRPMHAIKARALVVGHPDLNGWELFADLPGAREEAGKVAAQLTEGGFNVADCIDQRTDTMLEYLHKDAWRILHLSGHGVHDFVLPAEQPDSLSQQVEPDRGWKAQKLSGMVIGRDTILTPGDVKQMRWVPELVFINCCHLGKTGAGRDLDRGMLAANLGVEFIRMGVRAVVAAGWAVNDEAALIFADTFYRHMLDGDEFGEAIRSAREETWLRVPNANTWGAYQCYGDHSYRLHRDGKGNTWQPGAFTAPVELVVELENLTNALKVGGEAQQRKVEQSIAAILKRVPAVRKEAWLKRADVAAAIGLAWGEAGWWSEAIEWLEKALLGAKGDCPIRAVEQCANYKVRQAADDWLAIRENADADADADRASKRQEIIRTIEHSILEMDLLCQRAATVERLSLLGSACKRLALVQNQAEPRKEALLNMANYYHQALKMGDGGNPYPFTNWASAQLLINRLDPTQERVDRTKLHADADHLEAALVASNAKDPNFWDSASVADIDLVRLLARCEGQKKLSSDCQVLIDRIVTTYRNAIQRGASPREIASVVENLDFLLTLTEQGSVLNDAIRRIMEALR